MRKEGCCGGRVVCVSADDVAHVGWPGALKRSILLVQAHGRCAAVERPLHSEEWLWPSRPWLAHPGDIFVSFFTLRDTWWRLACPNPTRDLERSPFLCPRCDAPAPPRTRCPPATTRTVAPAGDAAAAAAAPATAAAVVRAARVARRHARPCRRSAAPSRGGEDGGGVPPPVGAAPPRPSATARADARGGVAAAGGGRPRPPRRSRRRAFLPPRRGAAAAAGGGGGAVALIWGWDTNVFFGHVDPHPRVESTCAGSCGQVFSSKLCEAHFRCSEYADYGGAFFITSRRFWCYKKIRPRCPGKLIHMGLKKKHARMTPHTQIPHGDVGPHGRKWYLCPTPR